MNIKLISKKFKILIDLADFTLINQFNWHRASDGGRYLRALVPPHLKRIYRKKKITLHRMLLKAPKNRDVDHINGDPSDNRRSNLRLCSSQQNLRNRPKNKNNKSGLKGVYFVKGNKLKPWRVMISTFYSKKHLGYYATKEEAHEVYKQASLELHGEFSIFKRAA